MTGQARFTYAPALAILAALALMPAEGDARSPIRSKVETAIDGGAPGVEYPDCPTDSQGHRDVEVLVRALTQPNSKNEVFVELVRNYRDKDMRFIKVVLPANNPAQAGEIYLASGELVRMSIYVAPCQGWGVFRGNPDTPRDDRSDEIIKSYQSMTETWLETGACEKLGEYRVIVDELGTVQSPDACLAAQIPSGFRATPPIGGPVELTVNGKNDGPSRITGSAKFSRSWIWDELTNPEYFKVNSYEESFLRLKLGQESPSYKSEAVRFLCEGYGLAEAEAFFKKRVPRTDEDSNIEMVLCALNRNDNQSASFYVDHVGHERLDWLREVVSHAADKHSFSETGWTPKNFLEKLKKSNIDWASSATLLDWTAEALVTQSGKTPEDKQLAALALYRADALSPTKGMERIRQAQKYGSNPRSEALPQWTSRDIEFGVEQYGRKTPKGPGLDELRVLVAGMDQPQDDVVPSTEKLHPPNEIRSASAAVIKTEVKIAPEEHFPLTQYYLVTAGLVIAAFGGGFFFGRKK